MGRAFYSHPFFFCFVFLEGDLSASGTNVKLCFSLFAVCLGHVAARVLTGAVVVSTFAWWAGGEGAVVCGGCRGDLSCTKTAPVIAGVG